jgi:hypothetical protein
LEILARELNEFAFINKTGGSKKKLANEICIKGEQQIPAKKIFAGTALPGDDGKHPGPKNVFRSLGYILLKVTKFCFSLVGGNK